MRGEWKNWPVHAEGAQVENGDAHRGLLQEGHQLTQEPAKVIITKRPFDHQHLVEKAHINFHIDTLREFNHIIVKHLPHAH